MDYTVWQEVMLREYFGNTLGGYLTALGLFIGVLVGLQLIKVVIVRRMQHLAKRTETDIDDFIIGLFRHAGPLVFLLLAFYVASQSLTLAESLQHLLRVVCVIVLTFKTVHVLQESVAFILNKWADRRRAEDPTSAIAAKNIGNLTRFALWVAGVIFVLDNLGINITAMVAGLGIGGVAIALAAQSVLGDAFSSFAIFLDRPFAVGDFIIVGDLLGTVEYVGFKTTRIRSLGGEQLIFSNSDLTSSRIKNYKRMQERRVLFKLGVIYQTPVEQMKAIPGMIKRIIEDQKLARFDRAHFQSYGDFALILEIVFYVLSPDYNQYMDVQQAINIRIMEEFQKAKIGFAYPTQQLYVTKVDPPA